MQIQSRENISRQEQTRSALIVYLLCPIYRNSANTLFTSSLARRKSSSTVAP